MVDLMNLLSDVLIGSFQMLMLNDLGKNMFPYRIKTCWTMNRGKAILPVVFTGVLQGDRKTKGFLPNGISEGYAISQTPQVVLDYQATDFNGELLVNWDYVIDAFDVEMIHSMFSENIKGLRLLIYS